MEPDLVARVDRPLQVDEVVAFLRAALDAGARYGTAGKEGAKGLARIAGTERYRYFEYGEDADAPLDTSWDAATVTAWLRRAVQVVDARFEAHGMLASARVEARSALGQGSVLAWHEARERCDEVPPRQ
jgi:hypothetical protein